MRLARERIKAGAWGVLFTAILAVLIVVGSRNLDHFDAALVGYTFATLFAAFGITYRYAMWLQRPPTRLYWRRLASLRNAQIPRSQFRGVPASILPRIRSQPIIFRRARAARPGALADHVGLRDRSRHHLPAGLGVDPLQYGARPD
jgi:hypothetical protein